MSLKGRKVHSFNQTMIGIDPNSRRCADFLRWNFSLTRENFTTIMSLWAKSIIKIIIRISFIEFYEEFKNPFRSQIYRTSWLYYLYHDTAGLVMTLPPLYRDMSYVQCALIHCVHHTVQTLLSLGTHNCMMTIYTHLTLLLFQTKALAWSSLVMTTTLLCPTSTLTIFG